MLLQPITVPFSKSTLKPSVYTLIATFKQAQSELLDRVASFCELERGDTEEQKLVMGMKLPLYHDPAKSTINLAQPWHSVAEEK